MLGYLEETYLLAKKINQYTSQMPAHTAFLISTQTNNISLDKIPKLPEEPFSKMDILLDYHLKAPAEIIIKTRFLYDQTQGAFRPFLESIGKPKDDQGKFFLRTLDLVMECQKQGKEMSDDIIKYVKEEKLMLEKEAIQQNIFFKVKNWFSRISDGSKHNPTL